MRKRTIRLRQITAFIILSIAILAGGIRINALASSARNADGRKNKASASQTENRAYTSVMIRSGDSLWSIARTWCGSSDTDQLRRYVEELRSMNHLDAEGTIYPGAYLMIRLPAR